MNDTLQATIDAVRELREMGAVHIKMGADSIEVLFPPPAAESAELPYEEVRTESTLKEWAEYQPLPRP